MERLREIIDELWDEIRAQGRFLALNGYVSPAKEKQRHRRALEKLEAEYQEDLKLAKTREARREARDAFEAAVKAEKAKHEAFFAEPADEPETDGDEPIS